MGSGQVAWFALAHDTVLLDGRWGAAHCDDHDTSTSLTPTFWVKKFGPVPDAAFSVSGCRSETAAIFGRRFPRKPHARFVTRTGCKCDPTSSAGPMVRKFGEEQIVTTCYKCWNVLEASNYIQLYIQLRCLEHIKFWKQEAP